MKSNRIESLTFLRFLAAFIVVMYHFGRETTLGELGKPAIVAGPQMVSFFFVLSGFVLMLVYYPKNVSIKAFYLARMARILPAYLVALALTCYYVYGILGKPGTIAPFLHLFFLQAWFPSYSTTLNAPGWSLSVEAFFYLTFPFLLMLIKTRKIGFQALLLILFAIWFCTQIVLTYLAGSELMDNASYQTHNFIDDFPIFHYPSFLLGVAGGYAFIHTRQYHKTQEKLSTFFLLSSFSLVYFVLQYTTVSLGQFNFTAFDTVLLYSPVFLPLIFFMSYAENRITKFLSLPVFVFMGEISYAMYIFQAPIYLIYMDYIQSYLKLDPENYFYVYLLILLLVSILSFYLIEKPGRQLIFRLYTLVENWYKQKFSYNQSGKPSNQL